jgi:branched-chain amino acid transport system substrate-binding protein
MRRWSLFVISIAAALVATACTSLNREPATRVVPDVKIGLLAALSGSGAAAGAAAEHGAELAAALVNGEAGSVRLADVGTSGLSRLGGAKLRIVRADTRGDPAVGASAAAKLIEQERVAAVVGARDADVTAAASQRSERLRVPFVNGDSSADFLTERGLDWFFRVGPTDRELGETVFSALRRAAAGNAGERERVGVVFADDAGSNAVLASTRELVGEGGGFRIVTQQRFTPGKDPVQAVRGVRAAAPDTAFLVASTSNDADRLVKAFGRLAYRPAGMYTLGPGFLDPARLQTIAQDDEGLFYSASWSGDVAARNPAAKSLLDAYEQRYQAPMTEVAAGSFTAVLMLAAAVDSAGSVEPERVRSAMLGLDVSGRDTIMPWDGVRFDASHQNSRSTGVVEHLVEGRFRVAFPSELVQQDS